MGCGTPTKEDGMKLTVAVETLVGLLKADKEKAEKEYGKQFAEWKKKLEDWKQKVLAGEIPQQQATVGLSNRTSGAPVPPSKCEVTRIENALEMLEMNQTNPLELTWEEYESLRGRPSHMSIGSLGVTDYLTADGGANLDGERLKAEIEKEIQKELAGPA